MKVYIFLYVATYILCLFLIKNIQNNYDNHEDLILPESGLGRLIILETRGDDGPLDISRPMIGALVGIIGSAITSNEEFHKLHNTYYKFIKILGFAIFDNYRMVDHYHDNIERKINPSQRLWDVLFLGQIHSDEDYNEIYIGLIEALSLQTGKTSMEDAFMNSRGVYSRRFCRLSAETVESIKIIGSLACNSKKFKVKTTYEDYEEIHPVIFFDSEQSKTLKCSHFVINLYKYFISKDVCVEVD